MRIETKTDNRKAMVQAIGEFLVKEIHYMGPPTFNYTVGSLIIDRDGVITSETDDGEELLMQFLTEKGYVEVPTEELNIQVPYDTDNATALRNIIAMLHARAYLLNRITRRDTFAISDSLLRELEQLPEEGYLCIVPDRPVGGHGWSEGGVLRRGADYLYLPTFRERCKEPRLRRTVRFDGSTGKGSQTV